MRDQKWLERQKLINGRIYIYILFIQTLLYVENTAQDEWLEKQRNLFTVPKQKFLITLY